MTIDKKTAVAANRVPVNANALELVNNAFPFCLKEARLGTTGSLDIERN